MKKKPQEKKQIRHGQMGKLLIAAIEANRKAGETDVSLSKRSGVSAAQISRLVSKERDIQLTAVDRLAAALGLKLVKVEDSAG